MIGYPLDRIYEEVAFLGYYLHWSHDEIMMLDHESRKRWCGEVSKINKKVNSSEKEKSLADLI